MNKKRKKKDHTGRNVTIGAAAVLLLLAGGTYGIGGGKSLKDLLPEIGNAFLPAESSVQSASVTETPALEEQVKEEMEKVLKIVVSESRILYNETEVTIEELEEHLLRDYDDSTELHLQDDHAIKAEYDEVRALLDRLGIQTSED